MMFNTNPNGQASKEPNKATSEDVTTVDWMIMTDIGTRIGKISKSKPESQPQSKAEPKSEFQEITKQESNKLSPIATPFQVSSNQAADDDLEDIEWLKSLDLDKPIERVVSTKKNTANNQQNAVNNVAENASNNGNSNGNSDVEKIDWLIVSDLNAKKIVSGFNNNSSSSESLPIVSPTILPDPTPLQVYPPSEMQTNIFAAQNSENDFGDLGLEDLELDADDDLGDLQFDDFDEMRFNELISGIGVTDDKIQDLSELMADEFSLNGYPESVNEHELEHELDTILGISNTIYTNDKLGIVDDSFEVSTQFPEFIVEDEIVHSTVDNLDIVSEQPYSPIEQDYAKENLEVGEFDSLEADFDLGENLIEENLADDFNNLEENFTDLQKDFVNEFDDFSQYPVTGYPADDFAEYPVAEYPVANYPVAEYPVANYPVDNLLEYPADNFAGYLADDLVEDSIAGYEVDDLAEYPSDLANDFPEDLEMSYAVQNEYPSENLAITEESQVAQGVFVADNFNSLSFNILSQDQEFANQEFNVPDIVNPLDDDFGEVRSPMALGASLLGDEIWDSPAIASPEALDGTSLDSNFENAFTSDWDEVSQNVSNDLNNDHIWDSSANVTPEVLSSTAIENAFGYDDDWAIAPQVESLQVDSFQNESFDLPINFELEVPPESTAKSAFTEQEYLELQEYDRIFAEVEVTAEITSENGAEENSAELAIASDSDVGSNVALTVAIDQQNTHLQSDINSAIDSAEVDDLGWNPESGSQLLADTGNEDYEEWNDELQSENLLDSNAQDLDWNAQPESGLVEGSEFADDNYAEWQNELQPEDDHDISWQNDLDGLIDSEQYSEQYDDVTGTSRNSLSPSDWNPDENQTMVVDDFDEMDSIIDENFDLASFDEGQFPEIPLTNSDSVNIATTLTLNRVSAIPSVSIPKPEFADLPAPAIAPEDDFSEEMLLEEALANDLLNQDYDLDVDPFEEALASDLLNGYTSSADGFNQLDDFVPMSETLPPPNPRPPSNSVMASSNNDFLDDFDFDSIEIQDFSSKDNSRSPAISTGLNPSAPVIEAIAQPQSTINNSFLPPPALPPLPPKRNHSQGKPADSIAQNPPIQPRNIQPTRDYVDNIDKSSNFDGFHIQEHQNQSQNPMNSIDESWADLLNADTVISGVLNSTSTNTNPNMAMPQQAIGSVAGRNSQGRDGRDPASARNNFQRQPSNLSDFSDLGLEIHDDNTDWSGLLDSDEANDSITSLSTQKPPLPRAQVDVSAFNTSITGSSATREIPRDRVQPVPNYGNPNQVRMDATPDQMSFNRFTEDNYDSYGSSQNTAAHNQNKPQPKTSTLSLESLWQNYLKIPVIGLGAIGAAFLLYTIANKPIFELGLRWGMFKDASGRDFKDVDFRGVKLDNVNFTKAILTGAKMQDASLSGANFYEANLDGVNFTNANLKSARLIRASVVWSEFKNAQMNLADLAEADLTRSNFATAKMEGANLKDSKIGVQGTESATIFSPTNLLAWQIVNEPKSSRNLANQNLVGLNLSFTSLKKANLSDAKLNFVDMTNTDLSGANLTGTQVNGVNWSGANLTAINLTNVVFDKSKLPKTNETTTCPNGKKGPCKFL